MHYIIFQREHLQKNNSSNYLEFNLIRSVFLLNKTVSIFIKSIIILLGDLADGSPDALRSR